jgi:hypothetical protein
LRYLLSPELLFGLLLFVLLPPESPPVLVEELPEVFSVEPELAGALESALLLLSLPDDDASDPPSDLAADEEASAEPLRA